MDGKSTQIVLKFTLVDKVYSLKHCIVIASDAERSEA